MSLWLIDSGDLKEVTRSSGAGPVGGLRPWVGGCMFWHDQVYTLMEMRRVFIDNQVAHAVAGAVPPVLSTAPSTLVESNTQDGCSSVPWVTILDTHFNVDLALRWDSFFGTRARADLTLLAPDHKSTSIHPWIRRCWQDPRGRVWHELSLDQLVFSPLFDSVRAP